MPSLKIYPWLSRQPIQMDAVIQNDEAEMQDREIEQTVKRESKKLFGFIRRRVANDEEAEDILQDVFLRFVGVYRKLVEVEHTSAWLFRVARNRISDRAKKKTEMLWSGNVRSTDEQGESLSLEDLLPDLSEMPDDKVWRDLVWENVHDALELMPTVQREVFVMHEFEDMSFKEIAQHMDTTVNTALSRKRYAIQFLRRRLQTLYDELNDFES